jgi:hypothetical protein
MELEIVDKKTRYSNYKKSAKYLKSICMEIEKGNTKIMTNILEECFYFDGGCNDKSHKFVQLIKGYLKNANNGVNIFTKTPKQISKDGVITYNTRIDKIKLRESHNSRVANLLQYSFSTSPLGGLYLLDHDLQISNSRGKSKKQERIDILTGKLIPLNSSNVLNLSDNAVLFFEDKDYLELCLINYIDNCTIHDLFLNKDIHMPNFYLKIRFHNQSNRFNTVHKNVPWISSKNNLIKKN